MGHKTQGRGLSTWHEQPWPLQRGKWQTQSWPLSNLEIFIE